MKAVVLTEAGGFAKLRLEEVPTPIPGPQEALVKVRACGVCYHDVVVTQGLLRMGVKIPLILGHEISGVVAAVGPQVTKVAIGDRVASVLGPMGHGADGGYAEYVTIPEDILLPVPAEIPLEQACIAGCPIGVGILAVRDKAQTKAGETVLVTGAGGGVGVHALQIAKACGARVLAVTSSEAKVDAIKALGADEVILSPDLDFYPEVMALTEGQGVNVVADAVGGAIFDQVFRSLAYGGRVVFIGEVLGAKIELSPARLLFKDAHLMGGGGTGIRQLADALNLIRWGRVRPVISEMLPLAEAPQVLERMTQRGTFGRVALVP